MFLVELFRTNPVQGIALILTLFTTLWSLARLQKVRNRLDRALISLIGLLAVYQGLRMLQGAGLLPMPEIETAVNLAVALLLLTSVVVIQRLSQDRQRAAIALRMAEANEGSLLRTGRGYSNLNLNQGKSDGLLDAAPMPMFAIGLDGCVNYWNHAAERMLGYRRDEILGQRLPGLMFPIELPSVEGRIQIVRKDGEPVEGSVRSVPIRDSRGGVSGILTILS